MKFTQLTLPEVDIVAQLVRKLGAGLCLHVDVRGDAETVERTSERGSNMEAVAGKMSRDVVGSRGRNGATGSAKLR